MQLKREQGSIGYDVSDGSSTSPPVIFLHGALGVRGQFAALRNCFADRAHLTLDFPSHGESEWTQDDINSEQLARAVLALLDELDLERVDIVGHSMGGYVGMVLAQAAPERINSVVTLGTKFYWSDALISKTVGEMDPAGLRSRSERAYDALAVMHSACGVDATLRLTQQLIGDFARWRLTEDMVAAFKVPMLVCTGDRDAMVPPSEAAALFARLDRALSALAILPGAPHPLQQVPLPCFEHVVRRFWEMLPAK